MFSKTFGHALRATIYIALHGESGKKISLHELSENLEIPHHFLGKIMQILVRKGIINSSKGPSGGFFTNEQTLDTCLVELLNITDGNSVSQQCALGMPRCNALRPCILHHDFVACRDG